MIVHSLQESQRQPAILFAWQSQHVNSHEYNFPHCTFTSKEVIFSSALSQGISPIGTTESCDWPRVEANLCWLQYRVAYNFFTCEGERNRSRGCVCRHRFF